MKERTPFGISKESWAAWKTDEVTQEFFQRLNDKREMLKEGIAEGMIAEFDLINQTIGRCQQLRDDIVYGLEEFETEGEEND